MKFIKKLKISYTSLMESSMRKEEQDLVDQIKIVKSATQCIKMQRQMIDEQKEEIARLKAQIQYLQSQMGYYN